MKTKLQRGLVWSFGASAIVLSSVAYQNRPIYRNEPTLKDIKLGLVDNKSKMEDDYFVRTGLYSPRTEDESFLLKATRAAAICSVVFLSRIYMEVLNDTRVIGDRTHYDE